MSELKTFVIIFCGGFLFFLLLLFMANILEGISCGQRWVDSEHRYSFLGGCQVKKDGKWVPEDRVRAVQ